MVSTRKKWGIWGVYLAVISALVLSFSFNFPRDISTSADYALFLMFALLINCFPIRTNYSYYTLARGLALPVYVVFGIYPEILFSSLALIMFIFRSDIKKDQHFRYPLNLTMVVIQSLVSGAAFQYTVTLLEGQNFYGYQMLPFIAYVSAYISVNQLLAWMIGKYYYQREREKRSFKADLNFVIKRGFVMVPLGFMMLVLYRTFGSLGILVGGVPYTVIAVGAKYYYKEKNYNLFLKSINVYSRKLSEMHYSQQIITSFITYLQNLFPTNRIYLYVPAENGGVVLDKIYTRDGSITEPEEEIYLDQSSTVARALANKKVYAYDRASEWQTTKFFEDDYRPESAVFIPLHILTNKRGAIIMTHENQSVYDDFFINLVEVFYLYLRIILDNAHTYETLRETNYTDFLTGIPNFRGFNRHFETVIEEGNYETLSLIVFDLDYFKQVNDIHGHEAGNEVLRQIAELVLQLLDDGMYLARYGGEEFLILLEDYDEEDAYQMAEVIRQRIEGEHFNITHSIATLDQACIQVTASFGIASYPYQCKDEHDLIKSADRIMYSGSKEGGRNKVSVYGDESLSFHS